MKQNIKATSLDENFLCILTTIKVFLTFLESMMTQMAPIFSNNTKYLKSSVQNGTDIFVTEKQYLQ